MSAPSLHHSLGAIPLIVQSEPNKSGLTSKWDDILTHDYFPNVNPYIRWMWTPLGTLGLTAVAAGLCGIILHPRGFVILVGILSVIGLGVVWPWLGLRGLNGTLNFDRDRAREGEAVGLKATLRNRLPWGTCGLTLEGAFLTNHPADNQPIIAGLAVFRGWRTTELTSRVTLECRGEYPTRPPRVASGFPFGLVKAARTLSSSSKILVWPQTFPVGPIPETTGQGVDGFAPRDRSGATGDMIGVRPYRRGDSLRRVHWPQSARHDRLVICELHEDSVPRIQVLLDLYDGVHTGSGSKGSREWAIRIAASFLEDWIGQGAEVEFVFQERVVFAREGSTQARRAQMLDVVARIAPDGSVSLPELLALPACRRFRTGLRVIVTTDLGLQGLTRHPSRGVKDLFVVLSAAAFTEGGRDGDRSPMPIAPWIWIDDPARIPERIRRAWKEAPLDR